MKTLNIILEKEYGGFDSINREDIRAAVKKWLLHKKKKWKGCQTAEGLTLVPIDELIIEL